MKGREAYPDEELRRRIMDFIMAAGQALVRKCSGWSRPWRSWHAPSTCGSSMFMY